MTAQTLARAEALGLGVSLLPAWYDVDRATDLNRLRDEIGHLPPDALPCTRRFLNEQNHQTKEHDLHDDL